MCDLQLEFASLLAQDQETLIYIFISTYWARISIIKFEEHTGNSIRHGTEVRNAPLPPDSNSAAIP